METNTPVNEMMQTPPPENDGPAWASFDVLALISEHIDSEDVAAIRCCCRSLRLALDAVVSSVSPAALGVLLPRFAGLKALDLSRLSGPVTDAELGAALRHLTKLTRLSIGGPGSAGLRTAALAPVGELRHLRSLAVHGCRRVKWSALEGWHGLRLSSLSLVGLSVGASDGGALAAMLAAGSGATLTRLVLGDARSLSFAPDAALAAALSALSPHALRALDLSGCLELTDRGLAPAARLTALRELALHNCMKLGDGAARAVGALPGLEALSLRGCGQLGDHHIAALFAAAAAPAGRGSSGGSSSGGGGGGATYGGLTALTALSLQSCNGLTGACLAAVARGAPRLKCLNLAHCMRLDGAHLARLKALTGLGRLDLSGSLAAAGGGVGGAVAAAAAGAAGAAGGTVAAAGDDEDGAAAAAAAAAGGLGALAALTALTSLRAAGWLAPRGVGGPVAAAQQPARHHILPARRNSGSSDMDAGGDEARCASSSSSSSSSASSSNCGKYGSSSSNSRWRLPASVAALDLRGAVLPRPELRQLLAGLPRGLASLDLSRVEVAPAPAGGGPVAPERRGSGGGGGGGGGHAALFSAADLSAAADEASAGVHRLMVMVPPAPAASPATAGGGPLAAAALCADDVAPLSRLTALTALHLSGIRDGIGGGSSSGGSRRSWDACGSDEGAAASPAPPPALPAGRSGGRAVRRVLDLDPWACPAGGGGGRMGAGPSAFGVRAGDWQRLLAGADDAAPAAAAVGPVVAFPSDGACSWPPNRQQPTQAAWMDYGAGGGSSGVVLTFGDAHPHGSLGTALPGSWGAVGRAASPTPPAMAAVVITCGVGSSSYSTVPAGKSAAAERQDQQQQQQHNQPPVQMPPPVPTWLSPLRALQRLALTASPWLTDGALASLAPLAALRSLDVSGCRHVTGTGFAALTALTALTELACAGCVRIGDAGVAAIAHAFGVPDAAAAAAAVAPLRRLDLSGCSGGSSSSSRGSSSNEPALLTDSGARALAALTGLTWLSLSGARAVGARATRALSTLRHLRRLDLSLCGALDDTALAPLGACPCLAELDVRGCWRLSEDGVRRLLLRAPALAALNVEGCHRLFGGAAVARAVPDGFGASAGCGVRAAHLRPGVISRLPPPVAPPPPPPLPGGAAVAARA